MPHLEAALLCDSAQDYGGRVSILGGFTSIWNCQVFPSAGMPYFVGRVAFGREEQNNGHTFVVLVTDARSETIFTVSATIGPSETPVDTTLLVSKGLNIVLPLAIHFSEAGMYMVILEVDGEMMCQLPLQAMLVAQRST